MLNNRNSNKILDYDVSSYSSCQTNFSPGCLKVDDPTNGESKWSCQKSGNNQFIILKLKKPALITAITFGKFYKVHTNSMKDFKVFGYNDLSDLACDSRKIAEDKCRYGENDDIDKGIENIRLDEQRSDTNFDAVNVNGKNSKVDNSGNKTKEEPECGAETDNTDCGLFDYPYTNTAENPVLLFEGFTSNDSNTETFPLKLVHKNQFVLVRYLKIVPIQAWGTSMNCFIWHVKLHGINDNNFLYKMIQHNTKTITDKCYKLVFDFLKKEKKEDVVKILQKDTKEDYEGFLVSKTKKLVREDKFDELERFFDVLIKKKVINTEQFVYATWKNVNNTTGSECRTKSPMQNDIISYTANNGENSPIMRIISQFRNENQPKKKSDTFKPCSRGGHGMVSYKNELYVQGGWDGANELGDFWVFDIAKNDWRQIENYNITRSCHKMVLVQRKRSKDESNKEFLGNKSINPQKTRSIENQVSECLNCCSTKPKSLLECSSKLKEVENRYADEESDVDETEDYILTIGKYVTKENAIDQLDLTFYNINRDSHIRLNTSGMLDNIYDHQIAGDGQKVYIMGGRYIEKDTFHYGKLYEIQENEIVRLSNQEFDSLDLHDRIGHNLLYYENKFVHDFFDDQKDLECTENFSNSNDSAENLMIENISRSKTQNLNKYLVAKRNLIIVGGQKDKNFYHDITFYNLDTNTVYKRVPFPFSKSCRVVQRSDIVGDKMVILFCHQNPRNNLFDQNELYQYNITKNEWLKINTTGTEPLPRTAHTFCYNSFADKFFLFGGNISEKGGQNRTNDMWQLTLNNLDDEKMLMKIKFSIRKYKYYKLVDEDLNSSIHYLREKVFEVVDHENPFEEELYKQVVCEIYKEKRNYSDDTIVKELMGFVKDEYKHEVQDLTELI